MHLRLFILAVLCSFPVQLFAGDGANTSTVSTVAVPDGDWPWWRGPTRDGIAPAGQHPPTNWSSSESVLWKTPVPGKGHASPIVVGDRVYLPTADEAEQTQSVLCFDRQSGEPVGRRWCTTVD
ncbi:MAG: PQQ-binding-like beta-propeller repeat protein [Planctomycetaceae bacterium]